MARAALFHGPHRPFELVTFPTAAPTGAEILVRVSCCTLCRSDLHTHAGRRKEPTPTILGHEIVGRIEAFGDSAPRTDARGRPAAIGDRVTWAIVVGCGDCFFCRDDLPQKCERLRKYGHTRATRERPDGGGLSTHITLVPGTVWYLVPETLSDTVAALATCAAATAAAVVRAAGTVSERTAVVFGAGVLGLTACAMLRAQGAGRVIVVDPMAECRDRAFDFGATDAVSNADELATLVHLTTAGRGADVLLELSGASEAVASALTHARIGGTIVLAGSVAPTAAVSLDPEAVVRRMLTIRGVHNYHPRDLEAALRFLAERSVIYAFESLIVGEYGLEAVDDAFGHAERAPGRRIAVRPASAPLSPGTPGERGRG
jgi:putative phosphonate catabolism associated alcohol dehydrogenase